MNDATNRNVGNTKNGAGQRALAKRLTRRLRETPSIAFYGCAALLVLITGWAAFANVAKSGLNADAAAWMQAAGTIVAIVGAAWIAQSEARRARRQRRAAYEEAAWYVRFTIQQAQFDSHIIAAELVNRKKPVDKADVREWRQRAATIALALGALIERTDHIHPAVTHVTSNAKVLVDDLVVDLASLSKVVQQGKQPNDELIGNLVAPHRALDELLHNYDERMRGVREALDEGGDALPIGKWADWNHELSRNTSV